MRRLITLVTLLSLLIVLPSCIDKFVTAFLYQYDAANEESPVPEDAPPPMQKIDLTDAQGNRTVGWYYEYVDQNAPLILYFHGNGENIQGDYEDFAEKMMNLKVNFALFDYPKYGLSTGETSEAGVVHSGQMIFDFLRQKFPHSPVIIWGRSLGCAPATIIAEHNQSQVEKLILTSPWDTFWKMVKYRSNLPDKTCQNAVIDNKYETDVHAKNITLPVLIHHGTKDTVVPWEFGKNLSGAFAGNDVTFISVEGKGHNDLMGEKEWEEISHFIRY